MATTLCREPQMACAQIAAFLNVDPPQQASADFCALVNRGRPAHRFTKDDLALFDAQDIDYIQQLGYKIA